VRRLAAREEISTGLDGYLLFTIYDLLFTIIVLMADRRFFINDVCLVQPGHKNSQYRTPACGGINIRREQLWTKEPEENFLK